MMIECGFYELPEAKTFHYAGYECAAWSVDTRVEAGVYPVFASVKDGHVEEFYAKLTGTIESDYFQSLYCGMCIGQSYDTKQNAGKPSTYSIRMYSYSVLPLIGLIGSPWQIDLSLLPNIGHCFHCGVPTAGSDFAGSCLCVQCSVCFHNGDSFMACRRFPRLYATLKHDGEFGRIADQTIAQAVYDHSEYHRRDIATKLKRIRAARTAFANEYKNAKNWFLVYKDGGVHADGRFLGRV